MNRICGSSLWNLAIVVLALVAHSNILHAQWIQASGIPHGGSVSTIVVAGTTLLAGTSSDGVFRSTNNGASWDPANAGLTSLNTWSLAAAGTRIIAGTSAGVFISTNNGTTWNSENNRLTNKDVTALSVSGGNLFAATTNGGIFLSTDYGSNWMDVSSGDSTQKYGVSITVEGTKLCAGNSFGGVYLTSDAGASSDTLRNGLPLEYVYSVAVSGANLLAGTYNGIFLSTNNGSSWVAVNSGLGNGRNPRSVYSLAVSGKNIYAGIYGAGVFRSTDNGSSWSAANTGLNDSEIISLAVSDKFLLAGTTSSGMWRRSLSDLATSVESESAESPKAIALSQNYPNPFNPATELRFTVAKSGIATLVVYNLLGQEVARLFDGSIEADRSYTARFDAKGLASGVYYARLQSENETQMRKMILLK